MVPIKKTEGFKRNPHYTPHWGDTVPCYTCHKEHKKSELLCANSYCHVKNFEGVTLKKTGPGGKPPASGLPSGDREQQPQPGGRTGGTVRPCCTVREVCGGLRLR